MQKSLDVIIPSFRLAEEYLLPILGLDSPDDFKVRFIVIGDNPRIEAPSTLKTMAETGKITLILNPINLGFSGSRNKGLDLATADWILLLDDDIVPKIDMLFVFAAAIRKSPQCLGFIGITNFPPPINRSTKAFTLNSGGQYDVGRLKSEHIWFPTANIALNRNLLGGRRFLEHLKRGGEDIEFFSRNAFENNQKYLALPEAAVIHPWWEHGKSQLKRMFNYGWGTSDIIDSKYLRPFSFYNFPSTPDLATLLTIASLIITPLTGNFLWLPIALSILVLAEYLTCLIRSISIEKNFSPLVAMHMMLYKNANELGYLVGCIANRKFACLTKKLDVGFNKRHPSPYRLNKWRILKGFLIILLIIAAIDLLN